MEFFGIKSDKTHAIDSESYKIEFLRERKDLPDKLLSAQKNIINQNQAYIFEPLKLEEWNVLIHNMTSTKKHIVKMIIKGHAMGKGSSITCETFNKEVFAKLLSHFPFDNKILLVQNLTCFGVSKLEQNDDLTHTFAKGLDAQNAYNRYKTIMENTNNDIINMGVKAAQLSNGYYRFYYGGTDERDTGKWDITYLVRKTDEQDKFWNMNDYSDPKKKKEQQLGYIDTLYSDLIEIKNKKQNIQQLNNNQYPMPLSNNFPSPPPPQCSQMPYGCGNVQLNNGFPPKFMPNANSYLFPQQQYYQQMPYCNNNIPFNQVNNYTNLVPPQSQLYQQNTYINNNINNNTTNTDNRNVGGPTSQTTQQQYQNIINNNSYHINSTFQDNPTEKNNGNVFCDLKSGICCGCKWW